jgi:hypothetical protein
MSMSHSGRLPGAALVGCAAGGRAQEEFSTNRNALAARSSRVRPKTIEEPAQNLSRAIAHEARGSENFWELDPRTQRCEKLYIRVSHRASARVQFVTHLTQWYTMYTPHSAHVCHLTTHASTLLFSAHHTHKWRARWSGGSQQIGLEGLTATSRDGSCGIRTAR